MSTKSLGAMSVRGREEDVEVTFLDSSEDEIFFGPISAREAKLDAKYVGRKTEILHRMHDVTQFFSMDTDDEMEFKMESLVVNDSAVGDCQQSQQDVSMGHDCIPETSMEDVEHSVQKPASSSKCQTISSEVINAIDIQRPSSEDATLPSQSSYESHFVSALEFMVSAYDDKVDCARPTGSVSAESSSDDDDERICKVPSNPSYISGVEVMPDTFIFEDSLEVNQSEAKSELDYCADESDVRSELEMSASEKDTGISEKDISLLEEEIVTSPKMIAPKMKLPTEKDVTEKSAFDPNEDKSCQTSFLIDAPPPSAGNSTGTLPRNVLCQVQKGPDTFPAPASAATFKKSRLPTPKGKPDGRVGLKSKPTTPSLTKQPVLKKPLSGLVPSQKTPFMSGSKMTASKQKYDHVRSPIAAYIQDNPPQLIQNVKPKTSRYIHFGSTSKGQNKPKSSDSEQGQPQAVKSGILKENKDNFVVPLPPGKKGANATNGDLTEEDDNENVDPFVPPLPYTFYKGSKIMVNVAAGAVPKQCEKYKPTTSKIPSPRTPIVIKHTGQHKKIQWADHLVSKQQEKYSPSRPTAVAPPILIKGLDFNESAAEGPDTVDASIVEATDAKRTHTLYN